MPDINGAGFGASQPEAVPVPPPAGLDGITPAQTPIVPEPVSAPLPSPEIVPPPIAPEFNPPPAVPFVPETPAAPAPETPVVPVSEPYAPPAPTGDILGSVETGLPPLTPEHAPIEPHETEPHDLEAAINPPPTPPMEELPVPLPEAPLDATGSEPVVPDAPFVPPVVPESVATDLTTEQISESPEIVKAIERLRAIAEKQKSTLELALADTNQVISDLEAGANLAQRG